MIQWYPGHMAKAKKEIEERLKLVDIVFELVDARIPYSSKNPVVSDILQSKPKLLLLTKCDLADSNLTKQWAKHYSNQGYRVLEIDSISGFNLKKIVHECQAALSEKLAREKAKGMLVRPIRSMIVGIPNVGKSTLINALVNKRTLEVADRPGVTKAQQWVRINKDLDLLDTPGVLWPKFEDQTVGMHLALTGAIKEAILKNTTLFEYLVGFLREFYPEAMTKRYDLSADLPLGAIIDGIADRRGIKAVDYQDRAMDLFLKDFKDGRLGKITLDRF
ncbi:MAG TPA: ribosome biogenesis GTPase YlqF [Acholeplasmatales bacterium]|nr:ribosome biogenesis GTPase YlqF [Acholeplasmatales bacterium]